MPYEIFSVSFSITLKSRAQDSHSHLSIIVKLIVTVL